MKLAWLLLAACSGSSASHDATVRDTAPTSDTPTGISDPCAASVACPAVPGDLVEGSGLRPIDRCAFPLAVDDTQAASFDSIINQYPVSLPRVTLAEIAEDQNRTAVVASTVPGNAPGVTRAYQWQSGDESVAYWTPQGITGSFDGSSDGLINGKKLVIVSWYYTMANDPGSTVDKGVRLAIADVTNPAAPTYRFALLATPTLVNGVPTFAPVKVHAGGLAWIGNRLYVPVTTGGFRVFDLTRILKVDGLADSLGPDSDGHYNAYSYAYVIPELERYTTPLCDQIFSFVSLDRTSTPISLISGEYDAASIHGRLYRWPLETTGDLQRVTGPAGTRIVPSNAWFLDESHIQGGLAHDATVFLSSSRPAGSAGELDRTGENRTTTRIGWSDSPEDLAFDSQGVGIWSLSELVNARYFFEVALSAVQ